MNFHVLTELQGLAPYFEDVAEIAIHLYFVQLNLSGACVGVCSELATEASGLIVYMRESIEKLRWMNQRKSPSLH